MTAQRVEDPGVELADQAGLLRVGQELARARSGPRSGWSQRTSASAPASLRSCGARTGWKCSSSSPRSSAWRSSAAAAERAARVGGARVGEDGPAAGGAGLRERELRAREQVVGVVGVVGEQAIPALGAMRTSRAVLVAQRLGEAVVDDAGDDAVGGQRGVVEVGQDEDELVAARAGEEVAGAGGAAQALGGLEDERVALGLGDAAGVEAQVDPHDGDAGLQAPGAGDGEPEVLVEQRAGGQAGQAVVVGEEAQPLLDPAALGDVLAGEHGAAVGAGRRAPPDAALLAGVRAQRRLEGLALAATASAARRARARRASGRTRIGIGELDEVRAGEVAGVGAEQRRAAPALACSIAALGVERDDQRGRGVELGAAPVALGGGVALAVHAAR